MLVDCTYVSCTISAGAPSSEISLWVCTQSESSVSSLHSLATLAASLLCLPALCSQYDSIYPKLRTSLSHKWVLYTWLVIVMIMCSVKQKKDVPHAWDLMTFGVKSKRFEKQKTEKKKATYDVWLYLDNVLLKYKCSRHGWTGLIFFQPCSGIGLFLFFFGFGIFYLGHIFCTTLKSWSMNYLLVEKGLWTRKYHDEWILWLLPFQYECALITQNVMCLLSCDLSTLSGHSACRHVSYSLVCMLLIYLQAYIACLLLNSVGI